MGSWLTVILWLVLAISLMPEYGWFMVILIGWVEGRELFGDASFGKIVLCTAALIAAYGYARNLTRWIKHRQA